MKEPNHIVYYCRSLKHTGKPIMVLNVNSKKLRSTNRVTFNNVDIRMVFNNSTGKAKRSGATTVLQIFRNKRKKYKEPSWEYYGCNQ